MNYYVNFIHLYTELDFRYMSMLLYRLLLLKFAFRPAFKCVYVQLNRRMAYPMDSVADCYTP